MAVATTDKISELRAELRRLGLPPRPFEEDLLKVYVEASRQFDVATERLANLTYIVRGPAQGLVALNPFVEVRDRAAETMQRVGTLLGLSPKHPVAPSMPTWAEFAIALHDVHD